MRIRLSKVLKAAYLDEPLSAYRQHVGGLSKAPLDQHLKALFYIFDKNKHLLRSLSSKERGAVTDKLMSWIAPKAFNYLRSHSFQGAHKQNRDILFLLARHMPFLLRAFIIKIMKL
jgi:hypothetical protein